ncbi:MAG: hypothetical protein PUF66_06345 [Clostridium sp.]|nr:hypothetical protein [Clostridium sp.]
MGKTDTIKAQEIVSNSKSNLVSNTPYHENSFIYRTTNEQINKYQDFLKNRENALSIIASGNQILFRITNCRFKHLWIKRLYKLYLWRY